MAATNKPFAITELQITITVTFRINTIDATPAHMARGWIGGGGCIQLTRDVGQNQITFLWNI